MKNVDTRGQWVRTDSWNCVCKWLNEACFVLRTQWSKQAYLNPLGIRQDKGARARHRFRINDTMRCGGSY